jgi:hypothetical protein
MREDLQYDKREDLTIQHLTTPQTRRLHTACSMDCLRVVGVSWATDRQAKKLIEAKMTMAIHHRFPPSTLPSMEMANS